MSYSGQVAAANLDAADGVVDGRFYGRQVFATTGGRAAVSSAGAYGVPSPVAYSAPVASYGAYGAPAFSAPVAAPVSYGASYGVPAAPVAYGSSFGAYSAPIAAPVSFGASYGVPAAPVSYAAPVSSYAAPLSYGAPAFSAPVAAYGGVRSFAPAAPVSFGASPFTSYSGAYSAPLAGSTTVAASQGHALALDAADGRVDGRHYGSNVVSARPY
eukprot:NODE_7319_length_790_cov_77.182909_g6710_i0.p1 GENE.NODE_7319_length_790_cov_77.182909_g6710_i0~~NODE_7319_length_790_cov_77.182909_g6710_i0.p1  ORF type:complete len:214 (+),score=63.62 NODE_7319_length_790_cov_77.182909_g6710_i0:60-701(+)